MKKYTYYIISSVILFVVALILFFNEKPGTLKVDNRIFAVTDTGEIAVIRLGQGKHEILLERSGSTWFVNQTFNARPRAIKNLLNLLMNLEIQAPVPKSVKTEVVQELKKNPIKVLCESRGKRIIKSYDIVENNNLKAGSVMMLGGDNEPYIVKISGFDGHISPLLPTDPAYWRDKVIFRYQPAEISLVEVKYPEVPKASFVYQFKDINNITINSIIDNRSVKISKETARKFLFNFASVSFESQVEKRGKQIFDSLAREKPYCEITVRTTVPQVRKIKMYRVSLSNPKMQFDLNRMYAVLQNDTVLFFVKYIELDPIMKQFEDFASM